MKHWMMLTIALSLTLTVGCVDEQDSEPWNIDEECTSDCEEPEEEEEEEADELPELSGTFVSGHLGNYRDCPGDGYKASQEGDAAAGSCEPGSECPSVMNCEDAQMTIQLTNTGDGPAHQLQVTTIELFNENGESVAKLPLMNAVDTSTNEAFDGELKVDEKVTLRVEFQGPENPYEMLSTSDAENDGAASGDRAAGGYGTIEMTITAENHDNLLIESGELYPVPSIDT